jgi:hypothetical protein
MSDYTVGDTIYKKFSTRAFATGIPTTLAGTPIISIYENDSTSQITAGITLVVDFDTVTGLNHLTIVATGGNGFESGKFYEAVITQGTVGGVSVVGESVWTFTLEASAAATPAQVNAEVVDVMTVDTFAEPVSVPAATASLKDKIGWNTAMARNKIEQTSTTSTLRNDTDTLDIAATTVGDDGVTFTRNKYA